MRKLYVRIGGGLGNQMFNYAVGKAIAERTGRKLVLDDLSEFVVIHDRRYGLDNFVGPRQTPRARPLQFLVFLAARVLQHFGFDKCRAFLRFFGYSCFLADFSAEWAKAFAPMFKTLCAGGGGQNAYVAGCYGYMTYIPARSELRREFALSGEMSRASKELQRRINDAGESSASLHVRRTDYLPPSEGGWGVVLDPAYYDRAIERMRTLVPNVRWFVFSDDIAWCREHFASLQNVVFVEGNEKTPCEDIALMARCRNHIIANSTFSWWGAYLASDEGHTICPRQWFRDVETLPGVMVPEDWIRL
jgi:hypothetical protein